MAEQTFKKDTGWGNSTNDFYGEDEITVTITLREYRELVRTSVKFDKTEELDRANKELNKVRSELQMAKARIEQMEADRDDE